MLRAALLGSYLIFDGIGGVLLLLAFLVWPAHVQVLHVSGEDLGHTDPRQNAHDWSQNQHQSDLRRKQRGSVLTCRVDRTQELLVSLWLEKGGRTMTAEKYMLVTPYMMMNILASDRLLKQ